jgi:hypothetical protein
MIFKLCSGLCEEQRMGAVFLLWKNGEKVSVNPPLLYQFIFRIRTPPRFQRGRLSKEGRNLVDFHAFSVSD